MSKDESTADRALHHVERTQRFIRRLAGLTAAVVVLLSVLGLVFTLQTLTTIQECTTPGPKKGAVTGHGCYDRGRRTTGEVVGNLVDTDHDGVPDHTQILNELEGTKP